MAEQRAKFTQMKDGDAEDYSIIAASNAKDYDHLADKVIAHLKMLQNDYGGFQVDRLTHSLQTATRAYSCLLYTSPSPRDRQKSRMPSSA